MKRLRKHLAFGGILAILALGAGNASADGSLFPNGEPNWSALRTAGNHSVASEASSLEARYRTIGTSEGIGLRSDKVVGMILVVR
jgi:hypothetical protein